LEKSGKASGVFFRFDYNFGGGFLADSRNARRGVVHAANFACGFIFRVGNLFFWLADLAFFACAACFACFGDSDSDDFVESNCFSASAFGDGFGDLGDSFGGDSGG
jgi:hypothetical protein